MNLLNSHNSKNAYKLTIGEIKSILRGKKYIARIKIQKIR